MKDQNWVMLNGIALFLMVCLTIVAGIYFIVTGH